MRLYLGQDYEGNIYLKDDVDTMSPELISFAEIEFKMPIVDDPTIEIDVLDTLESVSLMI